MEHDLENRERRKVIERLLYAWCASPHLRLGQLLARATVGVRLEYVFDDELLSLVEYGLPKAKRRQLARDFPVKTL